MELDTLEDFPRNDDSTIFVSESQRKGKPDGLFKRRKERVINERSHIVQFVPEGKAEVTPSKRETHPFTKGGTKTKNSEKSQTVSTEGHREKKSRGDNTGVCRPRARRKLHRKKPRRINRTRKKEQKQGSPRPLWSNRLHIRGLEENQLKRKTGQKNFKLL